MLPYILMRGLGVILIDTAVTDFADFVAEQGLMDLPMAGGESTWSNNLTWSRLDHFLVSPDWEFMLTRVFCRKNFFGCVRIMLPFFFLVAVQQSGKRAFKFENMWLKEEGFVAKVRGWWDSFQFFGSPSFVLAKKLKALKWEIKRWNLGGVW
jgi:hypothetical protein